MSLVRRLQFVSAAAAVVVVVVVNIVASGLSSALCAVRLLRTVNCT
jgi:hypothetical protein